MINDYPKLVLSYENAERYGHQEIYTFLSQKNGMTGVELVIIDLSQKKAGQVFQKTATTCLVMDKEEARQLINKLQAAIDENEAGMENIDRGQLDLRIN